jgi:cation transport protein ChaC
MSDLWVFGYGSLMWRPGFDFVESRPARLFGWHRALCVYSWHHRGTQQKPGLVLGLDPGGSCHGIAYRVREGNAEPVVNYLREREQVTRVYIEAHRPVHLADRGATVEALVYLIDRTHPQYAGALDKETQLRFVAASEGVSGNNRDYVLSTADQLASLGIRDETFIWLAARLKDSAAAGGLASGGEAYRLDGGEIGHHVTASAGRSGEEMNERPQARAGRKLPE